MLPLENFTEQLSPDISFHMIYIEGGTFQVGSEEEDAFDWEKPIQQITVPSFFLCEVPVTQAVWTYLMQDNPSYFQGPQRPVEMVTWHDTKQFLEVLETQTNKAYRLPTEAEWEYAARGGQKSKGFKYAGSNDLHEVGWFSENSHRETKPVRLKKANELGLFDLSGNIREWVEDQWHASYEGIPQNGSVWVDQEKGASRVFRGGGWGFTARNGRVAYRLSWHPDDRFHDVGFRVALSLQSVG